MKEVSDLVLIGVSSVDEECVWPPYLCSMNMICQINASESILLIGNCIHALSSESIAG